MFQGHATDKNVHPTDHRPTLNISGSVDCNAGARCRTLRMTNMDCIAIHLAFTKTIEIGHDLWLFLERTAFGFSELL